MARTSRPRHIGQAALPAIRMMNVVRDQIAKRPGSTHDARRVRLLDVGRDRVTAELGTSCRSTSRAVASPFTAPCAPSPSASTTSACSASRASSTSTSRTSSARWPRGPRQRAAGSLPCLAPRHGERAVILIDEYDKPLHMGHVRGYAAEVVAFFRAKISTNTFVAQSRRCHRAGSARACVPCRGATSWRKRSAARARATSLSPRHVSVSLHVLNRRLWFWPP
jgi:hypothetical protein